MSLPSNYTLAYLNDSFTVTSRPLTIKADAKSKVFGEVDPSLTYQITSGSLAFQDTLSGNINRTSGDKVGKYAINQGTLSMNSNYTFTYIKDSLTITPRIITLKADSANKTYGDTDPILTYKIVSGNLIGTDSISGKLVRTAGENMGKYSINKGTLSTLSLIHI